MKSSSLIATILTFVSSAIYPLSVLAVSSSISWTGKSSPSSYPSNLFGLILHRIPRGGEVYEPTTLEDVDAIILRASGEGKLVVIDFSATWCGPCKMIAPFFKELSEEMNDVIFIKIDVDENPETAQKYSVSAMPTFVFIKEGNVVDRLLGANPVKLQEMLQNLL